jgi:DNA-binding transcriptional LysR family regulator
VDHLAAIRTFLRVAELENFSEAARQLGLPKSLVTRRVSQLEQALGTPLLVRTTRRVRLTEQGNLYYQRALALVEGLDALEQSMAATQVQLRGSLRVSCPTAFGIRFLGPAINQFLGQHPNLVAEVILIDRLVNPAEEGFDVVLTDHAAVSGQFQETPLVTITLACCAAPAYLERTGEPAHPDDLARHDCIHYLHSESGHDWRFVTADGHAHRVGVHPRLSTNNGSIMRDAAVAGYGVAILPRFLAEADLEAKRLSEVLPGFEVPPARLKAVFPRRREVVPKTRLLVEFLRTHLVTVCPTQRVAPPANA